MNGLDIKLILFNKCLEISHVLELSGNERFRGRPVIYLYGPLNESLMVTYYYECYYKHLLFHKAFKNISPFEDINDQNNGLQTLKISIYAAYQKTFNM